MPARLMKCRCRLTRAAMRRIMSAREPLDVRVRLPLLEIAPAGPAHPDAGQRDVAAAQQAFARGWQQLELPEARLRPADACGLDALDAALAAIDEAA